MASEQTQKMSAPEDIPPIWRLGFRPFFLFASAFAVSAIAVWLAIFTGLMKPLGSFDPILWHSHEMIYGYATAVIAGFVLTASQNWTNRTGLRGTPLILLFLLWAFGRLLMSAVNNPSAVVAVVDLSFYPALAVAMTPYLKPTDMKVERIFLAYFALYFSGNLTMHLEAMGLIHGHGLQGALLGLNTTLLMIIFMGGRLIPFFTESEKAKAQPRIHAPVDILSHTSAWAFLATQFAIPHSSLAVTIAIATSFIHLIRLCGWYVRRVRRIAILWVLYISYFWICLGFFLTGLWSLGLLPLGPPVHALTIGGLGVMTYGMMSRVSLGHTGRRLFPSRTIIAGYILLNIACAIRVLGPIVDAGRLNIWVVVSGLFWMSAFILMLLVYLPILIRPRIDGRPG